MDYVVFGIGFGATILVLGLLLRDFGPRLRFRRSKDGADVLSAEELVGKVSWSRFCNALGSVLALTGAVFLLITLVAMILVVSDDTGFWIMAGSYGMLLVIIAYWTWAYFHRFGSYGILPERSEPAPVPVARPKPSPPAEAVYAGPPVPSPDENAETAAVPSEDDDQPTPAEEEDAPESEQVVSAADEEIPNAGDPAVPDIEGESPEPARLETPEERMAHTEAPLDHGSAEGDLDLAASGPRRPGTRTSHQSESDDTRNAKRTDSTHGEEGERD